jgi:hypothetical protein
MVRRFYDVKKKIYRVEQLGNAKESVAFNEESWCDGCVSQGSVN